MSARVEVYGSELRLLLQHSTPELGPGVLDALDSDDRRRIEALAQAPCRADRPARWEQQLFDSGVDVTLALRALAARFDAVALAVGSDLRLELAAYRSEGAAAWFSCISSEQDAAIATQVEAEVQELPSMPLLVRAARVFISYARKDEEWALPFIAALQQAAQSNEAFQITFWWDKEKLEVGPVWEQIQTAIKGCDLGLLLLSPAFLRSDFVRDHEIHHFSYHGHAAGKPCAIAEIVVADFDEVRARGIAASQIFRCEQDGRQCSYAELDDDGRRRFEQLVLDKLFVALGNLDLHAASSLQARASQLEAALARLPADATPYLQRNHAVRSRWSEHDQEPQRQDWQREDVLDALLAWVLQLYQRHSGRLLHSLRGPADAVAFCAFSGDGRRLITAGADTGLSLWLRSTAERKSLLGHDAPIRALVSSGDRFVSAQDGAVRLWDANGNCRRVLHLLPDNEFALFAPGQLAPLAASPLAWRHFTTRIALPGAIPQHLPAEALTGRWPGDS